MLNNLRQYILIVLLIALTINIVLVSFFGIVRSSDRPASPQFETMECADAAGRVRKCIRIDANAGEINDAQTGANYRVIYGY